MDKIEKEIDEKFGKRLRLRVNGVLVQDDKILMIKHKMSDQRNFWNVPGGGMDYGSDSVENLKREFLEETGLEISVNDLLCVHEFLKPPLHAVELYFEVSHVDGKLSKGSDPELAGNRQIIEEVEFLSIDELAQIEKEEKHRLFWELNSFDELRKWKGYFNFENNCIK
jgi:8-oxo-dGTP diphosphatase